MCSSHYGLQLTRLADVMYAKPVIASGKLNMKVSISKCLAHQRLVHLCPWRESKIKENAADFLSD